MQFDDYMEEAGATMPAYSDEREMLLNGCMGLAGEVGEVCDVVKKALWQGHDLDEDEVKIELGDVLWYVSLCARALGFTLDDVAWSNIAKLRARYPEGRFEVERSVNR